MSNNDQQGRGSGGKSLELMQQRLLSKPQESAPQNAPQQQTQQPQQQQQQQTSSSHPPMGGRGKDFAAMAASVGSASKARASSPPQQMAQPQQPQQQPQQQQTHSVSQQPASSGAPTAPGGRPKGKDFSAMATRMGAPPTAPVPGPPQAATATTTTRPLQPNVSTGMSVPTPVLGGLAPGTSGPLDSAAQAARAASLQAEARAAAGLPPLEKPTATSVTVFPPPVAPVRQKHFAPSSNAAAFAAQAREQHMGKISATTPASVAKKTAATSAGLSRQSSAGVRRTSGSAKQPQQMPMQQQQQQQQFQHPQQQQYQQQQHIGVGGASMPKPAMAPPIATTPIPNKPTQQPSASEARLSSAPRATPSSSASSATSAGAGAGGPHLAPLIGQRLQDMVKSIDPNYIIDTDAEEQVLQLADDFLEKVTRQAIRLANHRGSKNLDVQDVQIVLAKQWGIVIPGLGPPSFKPTKMPGSGGSTKMPQSGGSAGGSAGSLKRKSMDGQTAVDNRNKRANLGGLPPPPLASGTTPNTGNSSGMI